MKGTRIPASHSLQRSSSSTIRRWKRVAQKASSRRARRKCSLHRRQTSPAAMRATLASSAILSARGDKRTGRFCTGASVFRILWTMKNSPSVVVTKKKSKKRTRKVSEKSAAKTEDGLNLQQEQFCQLYVNADRELFG